MRRQNLPTRRAPRRFQLCRPLIWHVISPFAAGANQTVIPDIVDQIGGVAFGAVFGVEDYHSLRRKSVIRRPICHSLKILPLYNLQPCPSVIGYLYRKPSKIRMP